MRLRNVRTLKPRGKRVLVRVDFNIKTQSGRLQDTTRIDASLPTLRWLLSRGASVVLMSHRGRPQRPSRRDSLRPMIPYLKRVLRRRVDFISTPPNSVRTRQIVSRLPAGGVAVLENLRFYPGEGANRPGFARQLARLGDVYVNEAFAASHRPAASIQALPRLLPAYAGLRLAEEVRQLTRLSRRPRRPYVAVLGGAKISTKLGLIRRLLSQADQVLLGGALANTLLQAQGYVIGASLIEPGMVRSARGLTVMNTKLHIPVDVVVTTGAPATARRHRVRAVGNVGRREVIADIGPDTVDVFRRVIARAATIVWNGPMGVYEYPPYNAGTRAMARWIARSRARSLAGGGETVDAIRRQGLLKRFTYVSTGGGAMLEFLEGKTLPGLKALQT